MQKLTAAIRICFLLFINWTSAVNAETFICEFTEPFVTLTYSTETQVLMSKNAATPPDLIERKRVTAREPKPGTILWFNDKGKEIARLALTGRGQDGMSDLAYPYEIKTNLIENSLGVGGCSTTTLKPTDTSDAH